jgi:hypothetical protein
MVEDDDDVPDDEQAQDAYAFGGTDSKKGEDMEQSGIPSEVRELSARRQVKKTNLL